jgi:hypothetical protein
LIVSVKSTVVCSGAAAGADGWPLAGVFAAAEAAACLPLPFVATTLSVALLAFDEMIKRRRTGAGLASALGALWRLWLRDGLLEAGNFLFNINIRPK